LKYTLRDFCAVNDIPVEYTQEEIKHIKKILCHGERAGSVDNAIGQSERGLGSHTFGCKKIDLKIQITMPINDWQLCQCISIVKQEMYRYCETNNLSFRNDTDMLEYIVNHKKHFMYQLAYGIAYEMPKNGIQMF